MNLLNTTLREEDEIYDFHTEEDITGVEEKLEKYNKNVIKFSKSIEDYKYMSSQIELSREDIVNSVSKLGYSKDSVNKYIDSKSLSLSREDVFNTVIDRFKTIIKDLWNKIIMFFKKTWVKVQSWYFHITKDLFNLRKKIYSIRDKSPTSIPKDVYLKFIKDFSPYISLNKVYDDNDLAMSYNIEIAIGEFFNVDKMNNKINFLKEYYNILEDIYKTQNSLSETEIEEKYHNGLLGVFKKYNDNTGEIIYDIFQSERYKTKDQSLNVIITGMGLEDNKIEYLTYSESSKKLEFVSKIGNNPNLDKIYKTNKSEFKIEYTFLARLAEYVDESKHFILELQKNVFDLEKKISKIDFLDSSNINNKIQNHILTITNRMCFSYINNIIKHIKLISKYVNIFYSYLEKTTVLIYRKILEEIHNSKPGEYRVPNTNLYLKKPKEVKLIEDKEMIYFTMSDEDWDSMWLEHQTIGGFCTLTVLEHKDRKSSSIDYDMHMKKYKYTDIDSASSKYKNVFIDYNRSMVGLIFLDDIAVKTKDGFCKIMFNITGDMRFLYYHELGHLVTGQHENMVKMRKYVDENDPMKNFKQYTNNVFENRADAYACLKCGITPESVAEMRREMAIRSLGDRYKGLQIKMELESVKNDMIRNIDKEMTKMKSYVKLSLLEYIKLAYFKK